VHHLAKGIDGKEGAVGHAAGERDRLSCGTVRRNIGWPPIGIDPRRSGKTLAPIDLPWEALNIRGVRAEWFCAWRMRGHEGPLPHMRGRETLRHQFIIGSDDGGAVHSQVTSELAGRRQLNARLQHVGIDQLTDVIDYLHIEGRATLTVKVNQHQNTSIRGSFPPI
jgi:hypothetical protein